MRDPSPEQMPTPFTYLLRSTAAPGQPWGLEPLGWNHQHDGLDYTRLPVDVYDKHASWFLPGEPYPQQPDMTHHRLLISRADVDATFPTGQPLGAPDNWRATLVRHELTSSCGELGCADTDHMTRRHTAIWRCPDSTLDGLSAALLTLHIMITSTPDALAAYSALAAAR